MYALQICNVPFRQADGWLCKYSFSVELLAGFGIAVAAQVCIVVSVSDPKCLFKSFSMCLPFVCSIHSSFWLNCLSMQDSCLPSNLSGAGSVFGILLGVASPAAGAAAWLIFTYSYRQAKRRIVLGVFKYLMVEDIADASSLDAVNAAPNPSANVQMVDLDSRHPVRQASSASLLMLPVAVCKHGHALHPLYQPSTLFVTLNR